MKQASKIFTYEEVASILGISRTTIYNWQRLNLLPSGDYDIEKLKQAAQSIIEMERKELEVKVKRIQNRLKFYENELKE